MNVDLFLAGGGKNNAKDEVLRLHITCAAQYVCFTPAALEYRLG
jgi:hypothetical protein